MWVEEKAFPCNVFETFLICTNLRHCVFFLALDRTQNALRHEVMGRVDEDNRGGDWEGRGAYEKVSPRTMQEKGGAKRRPSRRAPLSPSMRFELELKATVVQKRIAKKRSAKKEQAATLLQSRFRGYSLRKKNDHGNRNQPRKLGRVLAISPTNIALPSSSSSDSLAVRGAPPTNSGNKWYRHDLAVRKMLEHRARPPAYFEQRAAMVQNQ